MNRSAGVTIAAVFSLLGSLLTLLLGLLVVLTAILSGSVPASSAPPGGRAMMVGSSFFLTLPGIWGVATSVGLFRLKHWARVSILIFAALLAFMGLVAPMGILAVHMPTPPNQDPAIFSSVQRAVAAFYFCLCAVGVWWLIFFTRASVKQQFDGTVAPGSPSGRPLSITVIGCLLLFGSAFTLISALIRLPLVLFNQIFTGWTAVIVYLGYTAICVYLGIGLFRLKPRVRIAAIAYSVFGIVAGICTYTLPGAQQRMTFIQSALPRMLHPESPPAAPTISPWFVVGVVLIPMSVQIYFLVTRKYAFKRHDAGAS